MMRVRPRLNPRIDGMGLMSPTSPRRAYALVLVVAVALLSVLCASPSVLATAREGTNTSRAQLFIGQATGAILGATFDRASYAPGDSIHAHLTVTPRGTMALPLQFTWTLSLSGSGGSPSISAITTVPEV